jgi:hypothetical protein
MDAGPLSDRLVQEVSDVGGELRVVLKVGCPVAGSIIRTGRDRL